MKMDMIQIKYFFSNQLGLCLKRVWSCHIPVVLETHLQEMLNPQLKPVWDSVNWELWAISCLLLYLLE